jgi:hypothetical protein
MSLSERVKRDGITGEFGSRVDQSRYTDWRGVAPQARFVTLKNGRKTLSVPVFGGEKSSFFDLTGSTEIAAETLEILLNDAQPIDNTDNFEQWAVDFGLDTDSRAAEGLYREVVRQTEILHYFLGNSYDDYMNAVDQ